MDAPWGNPSPCTIIMVDSTLTPDHWQLPSPNLDPGGLPAIERWQQNADAAWSSTVESRWGLSPDDFRWEDDA